MFVDVFYDLHESDRFKTLEEKYIQEELIHLFKFTLSISIEFRKGKINAINKRGLDSNASLLDLSIQAISPSVTNSAKDSERDNFDYDFKVKYYPQRRYFHFTSLYEFITGKKGFDSSVAGRELDVCFGDARERDKEEWRVFNIASNFEYLDFSNDDFLSFRDKLLTLTLQNYYSPANYITASNRLWHMTCSILSEDEEELKAKLKGHLKNSFKKFGGDYSLDIVYEENKLDSLTKEVFQEALILNEEYTNRNDSGYIDSLKKIVMEDFQQFVNELKDEKNLYKSIIDQIHIDNLLEGYQKVVASGENRLLREFNTILRRRIKSKNVKTEMTSLKAFKEKIIKTINLEEKNLTNGMVKNLIDILDTQQE